MSSSGLLLCINSDPIEIFIRTFPVLVEQRNLWSPLSLYRSQLLKMNQYETIGFLCIHLFHDYLSIIAHTLCKIPWFSACIQVDNNWHTFSDSNCCIFHEKEYYDLLEFIVSHIILAHFVNMYCIYMYFFWHNNQEHQNHFIYTI